jgi:hypothetical protein
MSLRPAQLNAIDLLDLQEHQGWVRHRDLETLGVHGRTLQSLEDLGLVEKRYASGRQHGMTSGLSWRLTAAGMAMASRRTGRNKAEEVRERRGDTAHGMHLVLRGRASVHWWLISYYHEPQVMRAMIKIALHRERTSIAAVCRHVVMTHTLEALTDG